MELLYSLYINNKESAPFYLKGSIYIYIYVYIEREREREGEREREKRIIRIGRIGEI